MVAITPPPEGYPSEYAALMLELRDAIVAGDYASYRRLQHELEGLSPELGQPTVEFPEEYYRLSFEAMRGATTGDIAGAMAAGKRIEELARAAYAAGGQDYDAMLAEAANASQDFQLPPECEELQRQAEAAFEREDYDEVQRLMAESDRIIAQKTGTINIVNVIK